MCFLIMNVLHTARSMFLKIEKHAHKSPQVSRRHSAGDTRRVSGSGGVEAGAAAAGDTGTHAPSRVLAVPTPTRHCSDVGVHARRPLAGPLPPPAGAPRAWAQRRTRSGRRDPDARPWPALRPGLAAPGPCRRRAVGASALPVSTPSPPLGALTTPLLQACRAAPPPRSPEGDAGLCGACSAASGALCGA